MKYFPVIDKRPVFKEWQTQATSDAAALHAWADAYPGCDFARITGESQGFFVLDVDNKNSVSGTASLQEFDINLLGDNVVNTRGGGYHIYYKWPKGRTVPQKVGFRPGLDTRANGGYVVAYDVATTGEEQVAVDSLPEAPASLLSALEGRRR